MHRSLTVPVVGAFVVAFTVSYNAISLGRTTKIMIRLPAGTASVVPFPTGTANRTNYMHHSLTVPVVGAFVVAFSVSHNAIPLLGITTNIMIRLPAGTASVVPFPTGHSK